MTVVAVTGAAGPLGSSLLARLDADPAVDRILGVDVVEPDMPVAKLDMRIADVRDPVLPHALDGADVVVHLAAWVHAQVPEEVRFARTVQGTRNVLTAAEKVGASMLVHLSTAMVYGAHPDNPVPLTEEARLRANPDAPAAYHALLAEELVAAFGDAQPSVSVAVLRPATIFGPGVESPVTRLLEAPRVPAVAGYEPTLQAVDLEDVSAALHRVADGRLSGTYNVAPEGWLTWAEATSIAGCRPLRVPEALAMGIVIALDRLLGREVSPGELAYLMHPWVVDPSRLRAAGWQATKSNRDVLRAAAEAHRPWLRMAGVRVRRRNLYAGAAACAAAATGTVAWRAFRRRNRR